MTDDLEDRLRAADPTKSPGYQPVSPSRITHLAEVTMNDTESRQPRSRWQIPAAAAAVLVLGIGGYAIAQHYNNSNTTTPTASQPMHLKAAPSHSGPGIGPSVCIKTTVGELKTKPIAFSGTVASLSKTTAVLSVDHWYRGGSAEKVLVALPKAGTVSPAGGTTSWILHTKYLVTATRGVVDGCGYTMPYTAHYASMYARAFG